MYRIHGWLLLVLLPAGALAAGLQPGEYHDHISMVVTAAGRTLPAHTANRNVCVTAADVARNGRRFAAMQNDPKRQCKLTNTHFSPDKASWHMTCHAGVTGHATALWNGDHYTVRTHMIQHTSGYQYVIDSTITGKRTGNCEK